MAQAVPAERDLRRVIGDGDAVPDGEVEGLTDHDLVELYRSLVLLRTYDERSVVYAILALSALFSQSVLDGSVENRSGGRAIRSMSPASPPGIADRAVLSILAID